MNDYDYDNDVDLNKFITNYLKAHMHVEHSILQIVIDIIDHLLLILEGLRFQRHSIQEQFFHYFILLHDSRSFVNRVIFF